MRSLSDPTATPYGREHFVRAQADGKWVFSCYLPASVSHDNFCRALDEIVNDARSRSPLVIAGNFNAWALDWGSAVTNARGRSLLEAFASLDLVLLNRGSSCTFSRASGGSVIDLTFVSGGLYRSSSWSVDEIYTASDHDAILFTLGVTKPRQAALPQSRVYKSDTLDGRQQPVFWWKSSIGDIRRTCLASRRRYQRAKKRGLDTWPQLWAAYSACRKELKKAIYETKREVFLSLCDTAVQDPWGRAYKIVVKRVYANRFSSSTEARELERIVCDLFPQRAGSLNCRRVDHVASRYHVPVTTDEVLAAARSLKQNKAPGPDSIPTSAGNGNSPRNIRGNLRPVAEGRSIPISVEVAKAGAAPQAWETSRGSVVISSNLPRGLRG
ncbi:uncharacterized protein [Drosophila tropicalis]|uniref:uncharacterized protein n=1 Tax=Drosophila tropicalis TaxID=46794 RepID=UPI0035ABFE8B